MFATAHLTSGLALAFLLGLEGAPFWALVGASVLTDWDYGIQVLTRRNHRRYLSHCPPVVALAWGAAALLVHPALAWGLVGAMMHLALDTLDYGVRPHPFTRRIAGFRLLSGVEVMDFRDYVRAYFRDRRFAAAEVAFAVAAVGLAASRTLG